MHIMSKFICEDLFTFIVKDKAMPVFTHVCGPSVSFAQIITIPANAQHCYNFDKVLP